LRIAQVSPLHESVPPKLYGGTERVVHELTEELVRLGHEVTLYASGDSVTSAELVAVTPSALRLTPECTDHLAHHMLLVELVARDARRYDIVHFHCDFLHFPLSRRLVPTHVTTLHGVLNAYDLAPLYREFADFPLVSISDAQRAPLPFANWQATIYHGYQPERFVFQPEEGDYLAFLGRFSPEKGPDDAIEIARRAGMPIKLAAKVDGADREYFRERIEPLLGAPGVEAIGEVDEAGKCAFLGNARALLFPIDWEEPFGLVMIEAMACGTPVVAYRRGSVPEVIEDGVTGFVVDDVEGAVAALGRIENLSRERCREAFERRFSAARMAGEYVEVYRRLLRRVAA
jgi:glycosyltransferase involved in cell wall biosynthesis